MMRYLARKQEISFFLSDRLSFPAVSLSMAPETIYIVPDRNHGKRNLTGTMRFAILLIVVWLSTVVPAVAGSPQSPESDGPGSFSVPDRGGQSTTSSGTGETLRVGYGRIRADAGSTTPSGAAIFQFRDSLGVLISEAGVPAAAPVRAGRIFAEVNGPVNTGLAIANPNDVPATIRFYFTDTSGTVSRTAASSSERTSRRRNSWIRRHSTVDPPYWAPLRLPHRFLSPSLPSVDSPTKPASS